MSGVVHLRSEADGAPTVCCDRPLDAFPIDTLYTYVPEYASCPGRTLATAWATAAAVYEAGGSLPPVPAPPYIYSATIVSEHDGDTLTATVSLGFDIQFTTNVRLLGMNARELSAPGGKEARDNLRALLPPGTVVTLTSESWDKYGGRTDASITYLGADGQPHDLVGDLIAGQWGAPYSGSGPMPVPPWPRTVSP